MFFLCAHLLDEGKFRHNSNNTWRQHEETTTFPRINVKKQLCNNLPCLLLRGPIVFMIQSHATLLVTLFKQPPEFLARIQQGAANTPGRFWCFTTSQHLNTQPLTPWLCIHSQRCVSHCESINPNFWSQTMKGSGSQRKNLEVRLHRLFPTLATNSWYYPLVWGHPLCTSSAALNKTVCLHRFNRPLLLTSRWQHRSSYVLFLLQDSHTCLGIRTQRFYTLQEPNIAFRILIQWRYLQKQNKVLLVIYWWLFTFWRSNIDEGDFNS